MVSHHGISLLQAFAPALPLSHIPVTLRLIDTLTLSYLHGFAKGFLLD